jgi:ABC-2 type transport system permease protein
MTGGAPHPPRFDRRRLLALMAKEGVQVLRDPSTLLIAFVLPVVLLFLFAYAVSLDVRLVRIGVVVEADGAEASSLAAAFSATRYFQATPARDRREAEALVVAGKLRGYVVIPSDYDARFREAGCFPPVQIVTDGSQPNTANFVANYALGTVAAWQAGHERLGGAGPPPIALETRFWFNPEIESRRALIPGALAIVMTIIATILTALVISREWERGTMEAIMSTPATVAEILIGKLIPYFCLGMIAIVGASLLTITVFDVPLRGSWAALLLTAAVFLVPALGQGLVISTIAKNQFIASQVALLTGFLPAFLLSGFLFEISSMPLVIRVITYVIPARYFINCLQTIFLAGDIWPLLIVNLLAMLAIGAVFVLLAWRKTRKSLD